MLPFTGKATVVQSRGDLKDVQLVMTPRIKNPSWSSLCALLSGQGILEGGGREKEGWGSCPLYGE